MALGEEKMKTAQITLELSGKTLENLLVLAQRLHRHPNDLTIDLLYAAIEASIDSTELQAELLLHHANSSIQ